MAKLSAHGEEVFRGLDKARGVLVAIMSDGVTLQKRVGEGWKRRGKLKPGVTPRDAADSFRQSQRIDPSIKRLPSIRELERMVSDAVCETPCGCTVEPDGICEHGQESWLLLLRMI